MPIKAKDPASPETDFLSPADYADYRFKTDPLFRVTQTFKMGGPFMLSDAKADIQDLLQIIARQARALESAKEAFGRDRPWALFGPTYDQFLVDAHKRVCDTLESPAVSPDHLEDCPVADESRNTKEER